MGVSSDRIDRNKSFCEQIKLQFHKEGLKRWRKKITVVVEWVLCASMVLLSTIMLGTYEAKVGGNIQDLLACMLIVLLMYCLIVSYVFAKTFTVDKLIFWRESGRDYHIMAFAIANAVMDLLTLVVIASVSALIFYDFRQPWVSLGYLWLWFLVITWGFSGYAYLFSTAFPLKFSMIITVLSNTVLQVLISGTVPFLRPGIMMKQWPLPIAAVMSTGYMACDSYMVSFGNQFPIQYRVGNPGNISEFDNAAAGGIMKMTSWGYLWYSHPNDSDHAEEIFERGKYFFDPLYIILIQGAVTRAIAFTLLHVMHRGAMGKPSIFSCKKIQQRRRSSAYKASTEMMVLPRVSSQDLLPTSHL